MKTASRTPVQDFEHRQKIFAALGLLILVFVAMILNNLHLNSVAEQSTKFISRMIQRQEFREVGLTLEDAKLDSFLEIHYLSDRPGRSFDLPASSELNERPSFIESLTTERVSVPTINPLNSSERDRIVYKYNRFRLVPYAALIWLLIVLIAVPQSRFLKRKIAQQYEKELSLERDRAQAVVAKEVRHNLRSPLAALMRIPARLPDSVKKDRELLQSTINQIKALIARLGQEADVQFSANTSTQIYTSLMHSVQEIALVIPHKIQFLPEVEDTLASAQVPHIPHELRALIGNVVSNSIDAIQTNGMIKLRARDLATDVEIEIQDSGSGIVPDIKDRIFDEGFSFGKKGSGTGLFHAKRWIEAWGGSIDAQSDGLTTIVIRLPIEDRANWYVPRIKVHENQPVFVVEDQEPARQLWRLRLDEAGVRNAQIVSSAKELRQLISKLKPVDEETQKPIFLFDYDLGGGATGMDLFRELKMDAEKYLVTGHFDDSILRQRCEVENIFLLPKSQLADVPIIVV
jgi:signal transduction histidine kinase